MDDIIIVDLFFDRNENAIGELERKYGGSMRSYIQRFLRDNRDAEEIYNDTLTAVWRSIPPKRPEKLFSYVKGIMKHKVIERLRYLGREKRKQSNEILFSESNDIIDRTIACTYTENEIVDSKKDLLNEFLASETKENRRIFLKRYYFGKSVSDIAKETGFSENAVSTRLSRSRSRLQKFLIKKGAL